MLATLLLSHPSFFCLSEKGMSAKKVTPPLLSQFLHCSGITLISRHHDIQINLDFCLVLEGKCV